MKSDSNSYNTEMKHTIIETPSNTGSAEGFVEKYWCFDPADGFAQDGIKVCISNSFLALIFNLILRFERLPETG